MIPTPITGTNKGLGKETARHHIEAGHTVYVGARDEARGSAAAAELEARFVRIDVTDDASVAEAADTIAAEGGLDVLIDNAGVEPRLDGNAIPRAADETPELMRETFETNGFGTLRVLRTFLPLLQKSAAPVVWCGYAACLRHRNHPPRSQSGLSRTDIPAPGASVLRRAATDLPPTQLPFSGSANDAHSCRRPLRRATRHYHRSRAV